MASKKKKGAKSTQATPAKQASAKAQPSQHGSRLHLEPSSGQASPEKVQPPAHGGSQASISRAHSKSSARPSTPGNNKPSTPGLKKAGSSGPLPAGVHLTAAASGDVQAAGAHKAGSKHRKKWPRGTRRQALAWGLFFMSLGALVTILGILWLEPADEGNGAQINIPLPGGKNMIINIPGIDLAALQPSQLGERIANLSSAHLARLELGSLLQNMELPTLPSLEALNVTMREFLTQLPGMGLGTQGEASESVLRPGRLLASRGYQAKHPVIIIPGFVTSGLELWQGNACAQKYFRQRMWGTLSMMQTFLRDSACWFSHMELDPVTGMDPPGVKIRAAQGLESVDFFIQGYWVWSKLVEALGDVGYDTNNIATLTFDWRLAVPQMEARDRWFTRAKQTIEMMVEVTGEKAVLTSHSYGENVARSFIHWVEDGWPGWLDAHVEAHVSIAGTVLGVPKAVTAILSGEMRDTAALGGLAAYLSDTLMPRQARARLFRTWGSLLAMNPVGGPKIWGNGTWAPDDSPEMAASNLTYGALITAAPLRQRASTRDADASPQQQPSEQNASRAGTGSEQNASAPVNSQPDPEAEAALNASEAAAGLAAQAKAAISDANAAVADSAQGLSAVLRNLFATVDESEEASAFFNASQIKRMPVDRAIALALRAAGSLVEQHYKAWAAQVQPPAEGGKHDTGVLGSIAAGIEDVKGQVKELLTGKDTDKVLGIKDASSKRAPWYPNALTTPLPAAPSMSIYHLYGTGLPTERAYHYVLPAGWDMTADGIILVEPGSSNNGTEPAAASAASASPDAAGKAQGSCDAASDAAASQSGGACAATGANSAGNTTAPENVLGTFEWRMNTVLASAEHGVDSGIQMDPEGDVTVPLISLGLMPQAGWRSRRLNPAGVRVVAREYKHTPVPLLKDPRGGPATGQHVDILGNEELIADVLRVACGKGEEVTDRVHSRIREIAARIDFEDPDGWL